MIQVQNICKSFGTQELFNDASFLVAPRERVGIVGRNGSGKSTLFKIILGEEYLDGGKIDIPKNYSLGYLKQHIAFSHATVHEEACSVLKKNEDGWLDTHHVEAILFGLGFDESSMQKDPMLLSGGFQIRLNLAKVLASEPNMLLLDEPTNHLDMESIESLIDALEDYGGTAIVVSHDEKLLQVFANKLIVFDGGKCFAFEGTYREFLEKIGWAEEKDGMTKSVIAEAKSRASTPAVSKNRDDRRARAAYIEERAKIVRPLEKEIQRLEKEIQTSEELAKKKEAELLEASEKSDGALIAKLATELSASKSKTEELFAKWEDASNQLEAAKEKYPL